jgi:hypothetical protein
MELMRSQAAKWRAAEGDRQAGLGAVAACTRNCCQLLLLLLLLLQAC